MASLWSFFKPDPHLPVIQDKRVVKERYFYWRIRILYSMFIGYALFYFTRQSWMFAVPALKEDLHLTIGQIGLFGTVSSITYGLSKFVSGMLSDRSNPRYFMAIGLIITGFLNIFFGLSSSFLFFLLFLSFNGWFQGFGWPPCAKYLTHWYSHSERGSWWSIWNVSHNVGAFMIPWIVGYCMHYYGWRTAMFVPGVICVMGGFFLVERLRDTPESLGLPNIETYNNDVREKTEVEKTRHDQSKGHKIARITAI